MSRQALGIALVHDERDLADALDRVGGLAELIIQAARDQAPDDRDAIVLCRLGREHTIELGPAVGFDLGVEATVNVEVPSWAEFKGWGCSVFQ